MIEANPIQLNPIIKTNEMKIVGPLLYCARVLRRLAEPEEFQIGHDRSGKDRR